jgi:hypothetical protein
MRVRLRLSVKGDAHSRTRLRLTVKGDACSKVHLRLTIEGDTRRKAHLPFIIKEDAQYKCSSLFYGSDQFFFIKLSFFIPSRPIGIYPRPLVSSLSHIT